MDGESISHYRVLSKLGSGGMGVVYSAEDLKLGRKVALKFLSTQYSRDPIALHRFEREARAASALNHPNICTIYEIDEFEGHRFIAMELLKGMTLRDRIAGEPLCRTDLLDYAIQITTGLGAAHGEGIIHRDVKPANIFVTAQGYVKLLDFGLAKLTTDSRKLATSTASTTTVELSLDQHATTPGVPLGTVAYMSPEQARGEQLDGRTDLFSFAAVLYEMATGRHAFTGNTSEGVVDAILHKDPVPARQFNPDIAPELQAIITKGLEKDRNFRYQTASDVRADLERVKGRPAALAVSAVESTASTLIAEAKTDNPPQRLHRSRRGGDLERTGDAEQESRGTGLHELRPLRSKALQIIALGLVVVLALAAAMWWRAALNKGNTYLNFQSKPGAQVFVDDKMAGATVSDGTLTVRVAPGSHRLRVTLAGYEAWADNVSIKAGDRLSVLAHLAPTQTGPVEFQHSSTETALQADSLPSRASIQSAPAVPVPPLSEFGTLLAHSNVDRPDLYVDGKLMQTGISVGGVTFLDDGSPGIDIKAQLPFGSHTIQLKKRGYEDSTSQRAQISAGKSTQLAFKLVKERPHPLIIVQSSPNASVRIDGNQVGKVGIEGTLFTEVSPGMHLVEVNLGGRVPYSGSFSVEEGERVVVPAELVLVPGSKTNTEDVADVRKALATFTKAVESGTAAEVRNSWPTIDYKVLAEITSAARGSGGGLTLAQQCDGQPAIVGDSADWTCSETWSFINAAMLPPITVDYKFKKYAGRWVVDDRKKISIAAE